MSKQIVLTSPDAELRKISSEVALDRITSSDMQTLAKNLVDTMRLEHGIGIAAPQIGVQERVIVVDTGQHQPHIFFNPKILSKSFLRVESEEGCLSVPGVFGIVKRHRSVTVEAFNQKGEKVSFRAEGLTAIVFQHEIDHLDGILFIDKVTRYTSHPTL